MSVTILVGERLIKILDIMRKECVNAVIGRGLDSIAHIAKLVSEQMECNVTI